jgi:hypothetical protein
MAKSATERRLQKRSIELGKLFVSNPERFHLVWTTLCSGWIDEIHFRASSQRRDSSSRPIPAIYNVFLQARQLALFVGASGDPKVVESLSHLEHITAKAVAEVTDRNLYRFNNDCTVRLRERFVRNRARD